MKKIKELFYLYCFSLYKVMEKYYKDSNYEYVFLKKFYRKYPELKKLNDFKDLMEKVQDKAIFSDEERIFSCFFNIKEKEIKELYSKIMFDDKELRLGHGFLFLTKFQFNTVNIIAKQRDYCIDNFNKDEDLYASYLREVLWRTSYYQVRHIFDFSFKRVMKKYFQKMAERESLRIREIYIFKQFQSLIPEAWYPLFDLVPKTSIEKSEAFNILENWEDIPKESFQAYLDIINIVTIKDLERFIKILENSKFKEEFHKEIISLKGQLEKENAEHGRKVLTALSLLTAVAAISSNKKEDKSSLVGHALEIGAGVAISSAIGL